MKKYNVGIIGYGWVATAHIAAINATRQARVTAVYSSRPLDSAALSAQWGGTVKAYDDLDAMLADPDLHAVSVCSYPYQHAAQAVAAARAGKHLIIEKPLALSWKDCRAIEAAAAKAGVKTCVCFACRYSSQFLATKAVIDQGLLGDPHYGEIDYYHGIGPCDLDDHSYGAASAERHQHAHPSRDGPRQPARDQSRNRADRPPQWRER